MRTVSQDPNKKYGIRHLPQMLRYAAHQRSKLKDNAYTCNAKMFGMPSIPTLNVYASHGINGPDGIVYSILDKKRTEFESNNTHVSRLDWQRHVTMGQDAMATKEKRLMTGII